VLEKELQHIEALLRNVTKATLSEFLSHHPEYLHDKTGESKKMATDDNSNLQQNKEYLQKRNDNLQLNREYLQTKTDTLQSSEYSITEETEDSNVNNSNSTHLDIPETSGRLSPQSPSPVFGERRFHQQVTKL